MCPFKTSDACETYLHLQVPSPNMFVCNWPPMTCISFRSSRGFPHHLSPSRSGWTQGLRLKNMCGRSFARGTALKPTSSSCKLWTRNMSTQGLVLKQPPKEMQDVLCHKGKDRCVSVPNYDTFMDGMKHLTGLCLGGCFQTQL